MKHEHPDPDRLTIHCPACIERVRRTELATKLTLLTDDELLERLMGRDHIQDDWEAEQIRNILAHRERQTP